MPAQCLKNNIITTYTVLYWNISFILARRSRIELHAPEVSKKVPVDKLTLSRLSGDTVRTGEGTSRELNSTVSKEPKLAAVKKMDAYPKRFQRTESSGRALSPTDSVISIGSFRPSLVWLFNHIRRQDQDALTKEDLRRLLDVDVDNVQLEEAFENLDTDRDGQISLDEFLAGFARFLREAPVTPGADKRKTFSVLLRRTHAQSGHAEPARPSAPSATGRAGGHRPSLRRRIIEEECFESVDGGGKMNGDNVEPSENFSRSLVILSSHNRY